MTFLRERDLSIEEHEEHLLQEIDAAIKRIEDGTYGTCEVDGTLKTSASRVVRTGDDGSPMIPLRPSSSQPATAR